MKDLNNEKERERKCERTKEMATYMFNMTTYTMGVVTLFPLIESLRIIIHKHIHQTYSGPNTNTIL